MPRTSHYSIFDYPNNIWCVAQTLKLQSVHFPPITCCLIPLSSTYLRQHPILENPLPTFLTCSRDHWKRALCPIQEGAKRAGPINVTFQTLIQVWDVRLKEHTTTAWLMSRDYVNFLVVIVFIEVCWMCPSRCTVAVAARVPFNLSRLLCKFWVPLWKVTL